RKPLYVPVQLCPVSPHAAPPRAGRVIKAGAVRTRKERSRFRSSERRANAMQNDANFEQLYRSHYRRVYGLCRQLLGAGGSAEDAAQETFMRAYRAFDRYDPAQPFSAWIMSIASRYCIDVVRRRAKEARLFHGEDVALLDPDSGEVPALDALLTSERAAELKAAIASLPDKQ